MRFGLAVFLALVLAHPCYAGGSPDIHHGLKPSVAERVALAVCVFVHVAALVESCWPGQRWYRPFAMIALYAVVVALWLGDRFETEDVLVLLAIASGIWAASIPFAVPTHARTRWKVAAAAGIGAAALCGAIDHERKGFLSSEVQVTAAVLILWLTGLVWVVIRGARNRNGT